jgi:F0F1-type ATP synthase epsilon subunit
MTAIKRETIAVVIRKKDGVVWQGEADSLSSTNEIGTFDILPEHTHFVGLIREYVLIRVDKEEKKWPTDRGILSVKDGIVEAYLGY